MKPNERGAFIAFGMESSFGENRNTNSLSSAHVGPMQMDLNVAYKHGLESSEDGIDPRLDLNTAINIYARETEERVENVNSWSDWDINSRAADLGLSPEQLKYLTWQQGRAGAIDIITTATASGNYLGKVTSGKLGKGMSEKLRGNMGRGSKRKSSGMDGGDLANHYIGQLKDMWARREEESFERIAPSQEEQVFKNLGLF